MRRQGIEKGGIGDVRERERGTLGEVECVIKVKVGTERNEIVRGRRKSE